MELREKLKDRMIQEYVPGKQITLAHIISNPEPELCKKLCIKDYGRNAIAILTITPGEASIIAADIGTKAANVEIVFVDRFSGSLMLCGDVASCEDATKHIIDFVCKGMGFAEPAITRS